MGWGSSLEIDSSWVSRSFLPNDDTLDKDFCALEPGVPVPELVGVMDLEMGVGTLSFCK